MASIGLDYFLAELAAECEALQEARGESRYVVASRVRNALTMFADHLPLEKIVKYSGLSLQETEAIGKKHGYL